MRGNVASKLRAPRGHEIVLDLNEKVALLTSAASGIGAVTGKFLEKAAQRISLPADASDY
jgi:hypothetical protein